jgi:ferredoxin, 2Fe-2S
MARPTITVHLTEAGGKRHTLNPSTGQSLMRAALSAGIDAIAADCGGLMSCATCHVYADPDWLPRLPPPGGEELSMLEMTAAPREAGSRLSCQIELNGALDGLSVRLPAHQY